MNFSLLIYFLLYMNFNIHDIVRALGHVSLYTTRISLQS